MFVGLFYKELKYQAKSIILYLFFGVILVFYITQFCPPSLDKPIEPLDEMHFIYWKLVGDYHDGRLFDKETYDRLLLISTTQKLSEEDEKIMRASKFTLTPQQKEVLKNAITRLNPVWSDKWEDITKIRFSVDFNGYKEILAGVDAALGGMTYYGEQRRGYLVLKENSYGTTPITDIPEKLEHFRDRLTMDLNAGKTLKYTLGFGKSVNLNKRQKAAIIDINKYIDNLLSSGKSENQIRKVYDECVTRLNELDRQLGGGTFYGDLYRESSLLRFKTYDEAKADFKVILEEDRLTNAYARYFADYMGIVAGFFTVFTAGFVFTRDKRYRMHEIINSRPVSAITYVTAKYLAVSALLLACFLIPATHATAVFIRISQSYSYQIDCLAFYKYSLMWILPTILFSNALAMLLSVVSGNGIAAILVQLFVWFSTLNPQVMHYSLFLPVIRFNTIDQHDFFIRSAGAIAANRVFFVVVSVCIILLTAGVWSQRRYSGFEGFRLRKLVKV